MKKGDIVRISYTGKVKETGELFDTTDEALAKKEGAHNSKTVYGGVCIVVGEGRTLKGLDEKLQEMKVGEEVEFEIPPEEAFGKRSPSLIKLIPQAEFRKNGITPATGTLVHIGNLQGKILSANSGRIRVDFNHPLAGRHLVYKLKIEEELKNDKEKAEGLVEYYLGNTAKISINDKTVEISTEEEVPDNIRKMITDDINKHTKDLKIAFKNEKKEDIKDKSEKK